MYRFPTWVSASTFVPSSLGEGVKEFKACAAARILSILSILSRRSILLSDRISSTIWEKNNHLIRQKPMKNKANLNLFRIAINQKCVPCLQTNYFSIFGRQVGEGEIRKKIVKSLNMEITFFIYLQNSFTSL